MLRIALKMLVGDRAKYFALVFGIAFATLLMSQQVSIFIGLMTRTANQVLDIREADIWVMDPRVRYVDEVEALPDEALGRIRSVAGVDWAVPLYKGLAILRTPAGDLNQVSLIGVDDATLVGAPRKWIAGDISALRDPDAIVFDPQGAAFIWPGDDPVAAVGREAEINDYRVSVRGIADASAPFITFPIAYVRYSLAARITPPTRNKMSFVLVRAAGGVDASALAREIEAQTGYQALTRIAFAWRSVLLFHPHRHSGQFRHHHRARRHCRRRYYGADALPLCRRKPEAVRRPQSHRRDERADRGDGALAVRRRRRDRLRPRHRRVRIFLQGDARRAGARRVCPAP